MPIYNIDNYIFVAPSKRKNKKYDVYDKSEKYITSFGALPYQHFYDSIGYYKKLNHYNLNRRRLYYARHGKNAKLNSAKYFSHKYLW